MIKPGMRFTHERFIEPDWKPAKGQKHKDGPKAEMVITATTSTEVYYRYANADSTRGAFHMGRQAFSELYWGSIREHLGIGS